jgi:hypothetical protein
MFDVMTSSSVDARRYSNELTVVALISIHMSNTHTPAYSVGLELQYMCTCVS